jgi:hypothetical protein
MRETTLVALGMQVVWLAGRAPEESRVEKHEAVSAGAAAVHAVLRTPGVNDRKCLCLQERPNGRVLTKDGDGHLPLTASAGGYLPKPLYLIEINGDSKHVISMAFVRAQHHISKVHYA